MTLRAGATHREIASARRARAGTYQTERFEITNGKRKKPPIALSACHAACHVYPAPEVSAVARTA